ncbi:hypothetical protein E2542_SST02298 [Spatholobus suberectus]|nr:hypothetical protein E2542_SST02298 [Spatholobus suberectus]
MAEGSLRTWEGRKSVLGFFHACQTGISTSLVMGSRVSSGCGYLLLLHMVTWVLWVAFFFYTLKVLWVSFMLSLIFG